MGNHARNLIDAIQHAMLDKLLLRLLPLLWFCSLGIPADSDLSMAVVAACLCLFALAWMIGAVANSRPRSGPRGLADEHSSPPNGFAAWSEEPPEGLKPPRLMRGVVMTLSAGDTTWLGLASVATVMGSGVLLWSLYEGHSLWAALHPALAESTGRQWASIVVTALVAALLLRSWAVEQRRRLEPHSPLPDRTDWFSYAVLAMFTAFFGFFAVMSFGVPVWIPVGVGMALAVVGLIPAWRTAVLDWTFGKRADA